jgi:hypothetical protein
MLKKVLCKQMLAIYHEHLVAQGYIVTDPHYSDLTLRRDTF